MKSHDFRFIRDTLGLSNSELAALLGVWARTVRRYADGSRPIPGPVERLMWLLNDGVVKPSHIFNDPEFVSGGQPPAASDS